jgi:oligoendopeptidase F
MTGAAMGVLPKREDIDPKYKWKLEDIYESDGKWEEDFVKIKELAGKAGKLKGTLGESDTNLLDCLKFCDSMLSLCDKAFVYARMRRDEDNSNPVYQAFTDRALSLGTQVYAAISFVVPEIISIPEGKIREFLDKNSELKLYWHYIKDMLRQKRHTLSEKEEQILALSTEIAQAPSDIFTMLNNADIRFPVIKDESGKEVELTKGRYIKFLESKDRNVRKDAFNALYDTYRKQKNTLAATLSNSVKKDRFYANVRRYGSRLEAALHVDNVPVEVYDNLIKTVNDNLPLLHRYLRLRRKALKLEELHMYDVYVPIVEMPQKHISYEEALEIVQKGLSPMGSEYMGYLKDAFKSGWIDVYENVGKTSGAYSWGSYLTHPYVLLNFQGTINDVMSSRLEIALIL